MNTRSSSRKASDAIVKPAKLAVKKVPPKTVPLKKVPTTKQVTLLEHPSPKYFSTKYSCVHFQADVEKVDMTEEMKEEIEACF